MWGEGASRPLGETLGFGGCFSESWHLDVMYSAPNINGIRTLEIPENPPKIHSLTVQWSNVGDAQRIQNIAQPEQ